MLAHDCVSDLSNLVDEDNYVLLEDLCACGEVMDETKAENCKRHVSRNHWVQITTRGHI